jgi:hypothetical protein
VEDGEVGQKKQKTRQAGSNSHVIDLAAKASTFGKSQEEARNFEHANARQHGLNKKNNAQPCSTT